LAAVPGSEGLVGEGAGHPRRLPVRVGLGGELEPRPVVRLRRAFLAEVVVLPAEQPRQLRCRAERLTAGTVTGESSGQEGDGGVGEVGGDGGQAMAAAEHLVRRAERPGHLPQHRDLCWSCPRPAVPHPQEPGDRLVVVPQRQRRVDGGVDGDGKEAPIVDVGPSQRGRLGDRPGAGRQQVRGFGQADLAGRHRAARAPGQSLGEVGGGPLTRSGASDPVGDSRSVRAKDLAILGGDAHDGARHRVVAQPARDDHLPQLVVRRPLSWCWWHRHVTLTPCLNQLNAPRPSWS
jgi:hypothetical protein